jgi:hypothetical protein
MSNKLKIFLTFSLIFLTSCATGGFKPNVVPRDAAGKSQIVLSGTVVSVKEVIIDGDRDAGTASGAVIGAIVGEFIIGSGSEDGGLGVQIIYAQAELETPLVMALILSATTLGFLFFMTVSTIGHLLMRKWHESAMI